jgi:hypothetical protein
VDFPGRVRENHDGATAPADETRAMNGMRSVAPRPAVGPRRRTRRRFGGRAELVAFALCGSVLYLVAVLGAALVLGERLPLLGWIGFGLVAAVVLAAGAGLAGFLVGTAEAAGTGRPALRRPAAGAAHRVLVVADDDCAGPALCERVLTHVADRRADVLVVAPTLVSPLHYLDSDVDDARMDAEARLAATVDEVAAAGVSARGLVGSESPLEAIADALALFPADELVVATPPPDHANWLEQDLIERVRVEHRLPVVHLVVEPRDN